VFDGDNHYYETFDCFTRHADRSLPSYKSIRWVTDERGKSSLLIGDSIYRFILNPRFERVGPPGGKMAIFQQLHKGELPPMDFYGDLEDTRDEYQHREARLVKMDEQGLDAAILLPTLGITIEEQIKDDAHMTFAHLRAFNRWLEEHWGYVHENRIVSPPLLSMLDLDLAIEELDRVIALGARLIHLQTGPVAGRSPGDPYFDPFWARLNEAGVGVVYHASRNGYTGRLTAPFGEDPDPPSPYHTPFQWAVGFGDRGVYETVCALIFHNVFGRHPNIRVASIELGAAWVPYAFASLDKAYHLGRRRTEILPALPSELMREHVYVSPFPEEDIPMIIDLMGRERVLMGSDWPHPEGLAEPREYVHCLRGQDDETMRLVTHDNTVAFTGVDPAA
jgi:predicted TIM-barrel fold metal-dependent hydrolase